MASTGIINATDLNFYVDVSGTMKKVANTQNAQLTLNNDMNDATSKDSAGWSKNSPGKRSWEMSGDALYQQDAATATYWMGEEVFTAMNARTLTLVYFSTSATGDEQYSGSGYFTNLDMTAGTEDNSTISWGFTGDGALTKDTVS